MIDLIGRSGFKSTWILVFFIINLIMGCGQGCEFKGGPTPTPIENLKLTLESKPHRDALKKILEDNPEVKQ